MLFAFGSLYVSANGFSGGNGLYRSALKGEQGLVISAESAKWLADFGWSKRDVKQFLYDNARRPVRELRDRVAEQRCAYS